jgi:hypothetical protein
MPMLGFIAASRVQQEPAGLMRKGMRYALLALGAVIMTVSVPLALLPGHVGVVFFAVGLVIVLRNSFSARRHFIRAQRRHPKIVFPIRRLIRREPEVIPVIWQQTLRFEQLVLPRSWRFVRRVRIGLFRRRKRAA